MAAKPSSFRRLSSLVFLRCQGAAQRQGIQRHSAGEAYHPAAACRAGADVPAVKQQHELRRCLPFHRVSGINAVPEPVDQLQVFGLLAAAEVAGKAHAAEALGQHVHEEGSNEFRPVHMHGFCHAAVGIILVVECHAGTVHGIDPAVADGAAEHIAGEVRERIAEAVEGLLDMGDPFLLVEPVDEPLPFTAAAEIPAVPAEPELSLAMAFLQRRQEFPAEEPAHGALWEDVSLVGGLHELPGRGQAAAGEHGVDVRVEVQPLALRVQHGDDPGGRAEVFFVAAEGEQRVRSAAEHQPVQELLVFIDQAVKLAGHCENGMVISNPFDQFGIALHDPFLLNRRLAAGAVAVVAGRGMDFHTAALSAITDVVSKGAGLAAGDAACGLPLLRGGGMAFQVFRQEHLECTADGIRRVIC